MIKGMSRLIVWPERDVLQCRVPPTIQEVFGKRVTVIFDCFEVEIEKPSNVLAVAQTWSNYKQRHTIKYLIGICPQGTICFVSKAFGGRSTDNYITENSGLLDKLVPHDLILADRGFNIQDAVNLSCAEVITPASTRGKKQLSSLEVEETRSFPKVRIHVERIIGVLRQKYRTFEGKIPISLASNFNYDTSALDKIVVVTSALLNISSSQMSVY